MDKDDLGNIEFVGKVKTQTFKQFQLERLIKEGKLIPASKDKLLNLLLTRERFED